MSASAPWLERPLTTLAFCWRLERRDGAVLGFTSHDQDLDRDGLLHRAAPGMVPSAIEMTDDFEPGSVELSGLLTSDAIRADDLAAGRWDGARLRLSAIDWADEAVMPLPLIEGRFGQVSQAGKAFSVEMRGLDPALDVPLVEITTPHCRARLGDRRCRVDLATHRRMIGVTSAADADLAVAETLSPGTFAFGRILWCDGANAGLEGAILSNTATGLTLADSPRAPVAPGDRAEIVAGCDRRFETCVTRFGNALNFRGEPHLPGSDLLSRYAI